MLISQDLPIDFVAYAFGPLEAYKSAVSLESPALLQLHSAETAAVHPAQPLRQQFVETVLELSVRPWQQRSRVRISDHFHPSLFRPFVPVLKAVVHPMQQLQQLSVERVVEQLQQTARQQLVRPWSRSVIRSVADGLDYSIAHRCTLQHPLVE